MGSYRSASGLPFPADWDRKAFGQYSTVAVSFVLVLPGLVLLAPWIWMVVTGEEPWSWDALAAISTLGAWVAVCAVNGWSAWPRRAPEVADTRVDGGTYGMALPLRVPSKIATAGAAICGVTLVVCGILVNFLLLIFALGIFAVFAEWYKRRANAADAALLLTADRITVEGRKKSTTVAWQDISEIRASSARKGSRPVNYVTLIRRTGDSEAENPSLSHEELATDFTRVYYLLRFYLHNSALRGELGTEQGLERFHRAAYALEPEAV